MGSVQWLYFVSVTIFIHSGYQVTAQSLTYKYHYCQGANYTSNSTFQENLNLLLPSLSSNITQSNKFFNNSIGQNLDKVYGILLCRGDLTDEACKTCADTAIGEVTTLCPNKKEYISWYDECMLRYSNKNIFSVMQIEPSRSFFNLNSITDPVRFNQLVLELMDGLIRNVTSNGASKDRFAFGKSYLNDFQKIFGTVQCTPDISVSDCNRCLRGAVNETPSCCLDYQGGRILRPSCQIRYEVYPFYDLEQVTAPSPTNATTMLSPPNAKTDGNGGKSNHIVVLVVVVSVAALILISAIVICFCKRKRKPIQETFDNVLEIENVDFLQFDFATIRAATDNFSDANKLGEGGFGAVYKGRLPDGQDIAVKRLSSYSRQGVQEFKNEVLLVAKLQHKNLVRLLGFCFKDEEKLLIYQFMPNKSLDCFIFDSMKRAYLTWETRYKIIKGIARGLLYLHEDSRLRIIHRDLKTGNILLDEEMNPKISDFGMARLCAMDQIQGNTNRIVGTYGYMSPEYAMQGKSSVKSDVYSYGVLLLEIVSGCRNNSFSEPDWGEGLPSYAWRHWKSETTLKLIDPAMKDCFSQTEVLRCIHIGLLCVQHDVADRPTIASVVHMLARSSIPLPLPSTPGYWVHNRNKKHLPTTASKSTSPSTPLSMNDVSITELDPR